MKCEGGRIGTALHIRVLLAMGLVCAACVPAAAQDVGYPNDGQDPTRPRARVDVRYQYQRAPGGLDGRENNILIVRADRLAGLGGGWLVATRVDLPFVANDLPSRDNPRGEYRSGVGDLLVQGLLVKALSRTQAFVAGAQLIAPTAAEDQMGAGKWQLVPTAGYRWMLDERGTFVLPYARYAFDFAGSAARRHVSELQLNPLVHLKFGGGAFATFWAEPIRYNFMTDKWFVPADVTAGTLLEKTTVVSLQLSVPIHHDVGFKLYDWRMEARIGWFF